MSRLFANVFLLFAFLVASLIFFWKEVLNYFAPTIERVISHLVSQGATQLQYKFKDKKENSYYLKAFKSRELANDVYEFDCMDLEVILANKKKIHVTSNEAKYVKAEDVVYLKGNVVFQNSDGVILKSPTARAFISKGYVEGDDEVESQKGDSIIKAKGFRIDDAEGEITFKGRPTLVSQK